MHRRRDGEQARRGEHFALARKLNMAKKGEAHPLGLPLAKEQSALLQRFAMGDAGAVWLREVADDTLRLFNKGYLEYDRVLWSRSVRQGRLPALSLLITGKLTETALFAGDAQVFKFSGYTGSAMAISAIGLGMAACAASSRPAANWWTPTPSCPTNSAIPATAIPPVAAPCWARRGPWNATKIRCGCATATNPRPAVSSASTRAR
ncbi:MAG: hypothetical protein IPN00_10860 [Hydrogenophilales bacterium]|nr:hypothetical protein [Hydrogenophilales bacterium]